METSRPQRVDPRQVRDFLADASRRVNVARKNLRIDSEAAYQIAYEAILKASLALMLSHGQRPRKQLGHHIAILEFAQKYLTSAREGTFALFDRMRRKRNDAFYDVTQISGTEAAEAVTAAAEYVQLVDAEIEKRLRGVSRGGRG